jgi:hypothetical protein
MTDLTLLAIGSHRPANADSFRLWLQAIQRLRESGTSSGAPPTVSKTLGQT